MDMLLFGLFILMLAGIFLLVKGAEIMEYSSTPFFSIVGFVTASVGAILIIGAMAIGFDRCTDHHGQEQTEQTTEIVPTT